LQRQRPANKQTTQIEWKGREKLAKSWQKGTGTVRNE